MEGNKVKGVMTNNNKVLGKRTILTTGTFLNGKMYAGEEVEIGGRSGDPSSIPLSKKLYQLNIPMGRLKTGTPPRIKLSSIDIKKWKNSQEKNPHPGCLYIKDQKNIKNNFLVISQGPTKQPTKS